MAKRSVARGRTPIQSDDVLLPLGKARAAAELREEPRYCAEGGRVMAEAREKSEGLEAFVEEAFGGEEADAEQIANELQSLAFTMGDCAEGLNDVRPYVVLTWADHLTVLVARVRLLAKAQPQAGA